MIDIDVNKLNTNNVISLYANYDESTKLYDDRSNWGLPACYRCRYASDCEYYAHEPYNKSSCFRFKWEGDAPIDIVLKRNSLDTISEYNYSNFKEGTINTYYDKLISFS